MSYRIEVRFNPGPSPVVYTVNSGAEPPEATAYLLDGLTLGWDNTKAPHPANPAPLECKFSMYVPAGDVEPTLLPLLALGTLVSVRLYDSTDPADVQLAARFVGRIADLDAIPDEDAGLEYVLSLVDHDVDLNGVRLGNPVVYGAPIGLFEHGHRAVVDPSVPGGTTGHHYGLWFSAGLTEPIPVGPVINETPLARWDPNGAYLGPSLANLFGQLIHYPDPTGRPFDFRRYYVRSRRSATTDAPLEWRHDYISFDDPAGASVTVVPGTVLTEGTRWVRTRGAEVNICNVGYKVVTADAAPDSLYANNKTYAEAVVTANGVAAGDTPRPLELSTDLLDSNAAQLLANVYAYGGRGSTWQVEKFTWSTDDVIASIRPGLWFPFKGTAHDPTWTQPVTIDPIRQDWSPDDSTSYSGQLSACALAVNDGDLTLTFKLRRNP